MRCQVQEENGSMMGQRRSLLSLIEKAKESGMSLLREQKTALEVMVSRREGSQSNLTVEDKE